MVKKALVVDNDFFFVEFLSELLEQRGYAVEKAYDGKEGISKLGQANFDILFVDLVMPKIDGKQLIRYARKKFPYALFSIIAVSGTLIEQMEEVRQIGVDYLIEKGPMEDMTLVVNRCLDEVENRGGPAASNEHYFEPENVYPEKKTSELLETLSFHTAVFESLGLGAIIVDKDARIISANSSALEAIHLPFEEVLASPITAVFSKNEQTKIIHALKEMIHYPGLKNTSLYVQLHSTAYRVTVSLLRIDHKIRGWILVLDTPWQWAERQKSQELLPLSDSETRMANH